MSVRAPPLSFPEEATSRWVLDDVYRSLESTLTKKCARRYEAGLSFQAEDTAEHDTTRSVHVVCHNLTRMPVHLDVTHVGGNVYDVFCSVEDGESRRFSYSLPPITETPLTRAPHLGRKMADFLLDELEKRLGQLFLQRSGSPSGPPASVAA